MSLSTKLRDLVREAYESYEDRYWARISERRLKKFKKFQGISHDEFWKKAGL